MSAEARHAGGVGGAGIYRPRESSARGWGVGFLLSTAGALQDWGLALPTTHGVRVCVGGVTLVTGRSRQCRPWNPNFP